MKIICHGEALATHHPLSVLPPDSFHIKVPAASYSGFPSRHYQIKFQLTEHRALPGSELRGEEPLFPIPQRERERSGSEPMLVILAEKVCLTSKTHSARYRSMPRGDTSYFVLWEGPLEGLYISITVWVGASYNRSVRGKCRSLRGFLAVSYDDDILLTQPRWIQQMMVDHLDVGTILLVNHYTVQ